MNNQESILRFFREYEERKLTGSNNFTANTFSHVSSSQREILNAIFIGEKLEKSDKLVDAVKNTTIKNSRYELNIATASDAKGDLTSNPFTVTHTSNGILEQKLLSCWTIREVFILPNPTNPMIYTTGLMP